MVGCYIKNFRAPKNCWDCWMRGIEKIVECYEYPQPINRDMGRPFTCPIKEIPYEEVS